MSRHTQALRSLPLLGLAALLLSAGTQAETRVIRTGDINHPNDRYVIDMLELALSRVDKDYRTEIVPGAITQSRAISSVLSGTLDLMWAATNQEMEDTLIPVRVPLLKGLLGHRIFIIHRDRQPLFDRVETFEDLQKFTFGQGTTWADTAILEHNGLEVVRVNKFDSLLYMVDGGRFDAFPRGVQEPWSEIESRENLALAVEERLMLVYRMPFYMFVGPSEEELAADIERGLLLAIEDGGFDELFFDNHMVKDALEKSNLQQRRAFYLDNPTLPPETPVDNAKLWLDVSAL